MTTYKVYVDGACSNNGKANAKSGIGIYFGKNDVRNVSAFLKEGKQTNNRAELMAILVVLKIIEVTCEKICKYLICTDSKYSIDCITNWIYKWKKNDWKTANNKPVQNQELIEKIYNMLNKLNNVEFLHVKGHSNSSDKDSVGNRIADKLAVRSIK